MPGASHVFFFEVAPLQVSLKGFSNWRQSHVHVPNLSYIHLGVCTHTHTHTSASTRSQSLCADCSFVQQHLIDIYASISVVLAGSSVCNCVSSLYIHILYLFPPFQREYVVDKSTDSPRQRHTACPTLQLGSNNCMDAGKVYCWVKVAGTSFPSFLFFDF